jgi:hypothetical protein
MRKLPKPKDAKIELKEATVRDFSGGYNVLDNDLNLSSKFSTKMFNCYHSASGTVKTRQGTRLFVNLTDVTSTSDCYPVNIEYFAASLIAVMSNGELVSVEADGTLAVIWNTAIAGALPGAPSAWTNGIEFASFEQFNGELIVCNGVDKPLIINSALSVDYLQDLATLSNLNTPICRYVTTCARYLIMAGDPAHPNRIHISARDTSGTWFDDPAPNDATFVDVGSSLKNASVIKGIRGFKGRLVIAFEEGIVIGVLGVYDDDGNHTPNTDETIQQFGSVSHRVMADLGDDMLMLDNVGIPSLKRTVFSGSIKPERASDLVDPDITPRLEILSTIALEDRTFSVYDQREGQFLFFIPNAITREATTETTCFAYLFRPALGLNSWARFDGMNWTCACRTVQGNIFFGDFDGKLWLYGSSTNPIYKDREGDEEVNDGEGVGIDFTWTLPWSPLNKRRKLKKTKYIALDTSGTGSFSVKMYVDRFMLDENLDDCPLLEMEFVGGDVMGFGGEASPFGGGRITADENLYKWPAKFKIMKLEFTGTVETSLEFVSVTLFYQEGGVYI